MAGKRRSRKSRSSRPERKPSPTSTTDRPTLTPKEISMRTTHLLRMTALLVPLALAGCGGTSSPPGDGGYGVKGTAVAVAPAKPEVTLDHEAIPGPMKPLQDIPFS